MSTRYPILSLALAVAGSFVVLVPPAVTRRSVIINACPGPQIPAPASRSSMRASA
jgi:hypothetical protein